MAMASSSLSMANTSTSASNDRSQTHSSVADTPGPRSDTRPATPAMIAAPTATTSDARGPAFPPPGCVLEPDDARDKILMGICSALAHVENRALTPKQIVEVMSTLGVKLGGNTPASTVSTHIRAHLARATRPLLLRHSLLARRSSEARVEDRAVGIDPDSGERKKGTAWYLSEAAGHSSPWERLGIPQPRSQSSELVNNSRSSPSPTPAPAPMDVTHSPLPQRISSRKRTRTKSWSAAARELGMDGMSPPPDFGDESEAETHRERRAKVRIRLRVGSLSATSRSSSVRPDDAQPDASSDSDAARCAPPIRSRVFSAPCPQLTHSRRSLSNPSSGGPPTPHALEFVDEHSDVEDGDFHVRMMHNDSAPPSPRKADPAPLVGIGLGLIFEGSERNGVRVKEESEPSVSPPSLSSRASSLAASSLPEDDVWAVKIEEVEDIKMAVDMPPFEAAVPCETGLGFDLDATYEGFEAEFAMLGVHSPTIIPNAFIRDPDHADGPESVQLDEVDRLWSEWGAELDKRAHTRTTRASRTSSAKRRDSVCTWGCRAAPGMRVSLGATRPRACSDSLVKGVVVQREQELKIERTVLHGVEYASCIVRGCVLLRRLEDAYICLSALLRACRLPGSCHSHYRTAGTVDLIAPPPHTDATSDPNTQSTIPATQPTQNSTTLHTPEPSDVLHTTMSPETVHPDTMPQGASIDFGMGVEAAEISGMWCPLAEARAIAEERLRPYLPEDVRSAFLGEVLEIKEPEPMGSEPDEPESKIEADPEPPRDSTPRAPAHEKVIAASEDDVSIFVHPSSPATVACTPRRILRTRPARVIRTRART